MVKIVRVRLLKDELKSTYGEYMHRALEVAVRGQAAGLWEIVDGVATNSAAPRRRQKHSKEDPAAYMTREMFARTVGPRIYAKDLSGD